MSKPTSLVKVREASRLLGISEETIHRRIKSGEYPIYRLGPKCVRLDVEEIMQLARRERFTPDREERV